MTLNLRQGQSLLVEGWGQIPEQFNYMGTGGSPAGRSKGEVGQPGGRATELAPCGCKGRGGVVPVPFLAVRQEFSKCLEVSSSVSNPSHAPSLSYLPFTDHLEKPLLLEGSCD